VALNTDAHLRASIPARPLRVRLIGEAGGPRALQFATRGHTSLSDRIKQVRPFFRESAILPSSLNARKMESPVFVTIAPRYTAGLDSTVTAHWQPEHKPEVLKPEVVVNKNLNDFGVSTLLVSCFTTILMARSTLRATSRTASDGM
jgi:hypothetical protein